MGVVSTMDEKFDPVSAELDQLTDEEIGARLQRRPFGLMKSVRSF